MWQTCRGQRIVCKNRFSPLPYGSQGQTQIIWHRGKHQCPLGYHRLNCFLLEAASCWATQAVLRIDPLASDSQILELWLPLLLGVGHYLDFKIKHHSMCISCFSTAMIKHHDQSNFWKSWFWIMQCPWRQLVERQLTDPFSSPSRKQSDRLVGRGYKLSKPTLRAVLPPARLHLRDFINSWHYRWGPHIHKGELGKDISHSTATVWD